MPDLLPKRVARVKLRLENITTGNTRHYIDGVETPRPVELQIVTYGQDPGYYLFYCDAAGVEMTDTYHDTVKEAMEQAEFEFGVKVDDWVFSDDVHQRSTATSATEPGFSELYPDV